MRTFQLSPPIQAYMDALVALASADAPIPAPPPAPTNPEELAFYTTRLLPLAAAIQAALAARARIWSPTPLSVSNPYALDASGQPLFPEMWGTQAGSP